MRFYWIMLATAITTSMAGQTLLKAGASVPNFIAQLFDLSLGEARLVDLHQQMCAALQIEAKHDRAGRNPGRQPLLQRANGRGVEKTRHNQE